MHLYLAMHLYALFWCSKELGGSAQKDYIVNNMVNTVLEYLNSVFLITYLNFMKPYITVTLQPFAFPGHLFQLSLQLFPDSSGINFHNLAVGTGNPPSSFPCCCCL